MKCKFNKTKECIHAELFDKWKGDKYQTGWLTLGVCPKCPIYREATDCEEVEDNAKRA